MLVYPISIFAEIPSDQFARRALHAACTIGLILGFLACIVLYPGKRSQISLPLTGWLACCYGILCVLNRDTALGFLILFLPLQNKAVQGLPVTISDLLILALAVSVWLRVILGGNAFRFAPETGWVLLWMIVALISSMVSVDPGRSLRLWMRSAFGIVLFLILRDHIRTRLQFDRLIVWALLSGLFLAAYGFGEWFVRIAALPWQFIGRFNDWIRIQSYVTQSNFLAWLLVLVVPWGIAAFLSADIRRDRIFWGLAVTAIVSTIGLTFSRGGWLALAIVIFAVPIGRKIKGIGLVGLIAIILITTPILANLKARGVSAERRFQRYLSAPSLMVRHPVWGYGLGSYGFLNRYTPGALPPELQGKYSHSLYITLAVETGIISLSLFGIILVRIGRNAYRLFRLPQGQSPPNRIRIGTLLAAFVGLLTLEVFHSNLHTVMFWVWLAVFQMAPAVLISDPSESPVPV